MVGRTRPYMLRARTGVVRLSYGHAHRHDRALIAARACVLERTLRGTIGRTRVERRVRERELLDGADPDLPGIERRRQCRGHPAHLNLADCLAYAVAKHTGVPLLYIGEDFRRTDIHPALPAG